MLWVSFPQKVVIYVRPIAAQLWCKFAACVVIFPKSTKYVVAEVCICMLTSNGLHKETAHHNQQQKNMHTSALYCN